MNSKLTFPKRGILHFVSDDKCIYSINQRLFYESQDHKFVLKLEKRPNFNLVNRIFRRGIHKVIENGDFLFVVINKEIQIISIDLKLVVAKHSLRGNRPLVIEKYRDGIVYGEYANNKIRNKMAIVHLDKSGCEHILRFITGIRHIHSITKIDQTNKFIVTTGDEDDESKIMIFADDFQNYKIIAEGSQRFRVVQPIVRENFLYFGSDIPNKQNHIYKIDLLSGASEELAEIPGPVFYGIKKNNIIFFSTVNEPSQVNDQKFCYLLQIGLDDIVHKKAAFQKDIIPMRLGQYGQILFPRYDVSTNKMIYFTEFATLNHLQIHKFLL